MIMKHKNKKEKSVALKIRNTDSADFPLHLLEGLRANSSLPKLPFERDFTALKCFKGNVLQSMKSSWSAVSGFSE